jgi:hypothetical protein
MQRAWLAGNGNGTRFPGARASVLFCMRLDRPRSRCKQPIGVKLAPTSLVRCDTANQTCPRLQRWCRGGGGWRRSQGEGCRRRFQGATKEVVGEGRTDGGAASPHSTVAVDNRAMTVDDAQGEAKGAERGVAIGASLRRCKQAATRRASVVGWGWEQASG